MSLAGAINTTSTLRLKIDLAALELSSPHRYTAVLIQCVHTLLAK